MIKELLEQANAEYRQAQKDAKAEGKKVDLLQFERDFLLSLNGISATRQEFTALKKVFKPFVSTYLLDISQQEDGIIAVAEHYEVYLDVVSGEASIQQKAFGEGATYIRIDRRLIDGAQWFDFVGEGANDKINR